MLLVVRRLCQLLDVPLVRIVLRDDVLMEVALAERVSLVAVRHSDTTVLRMVDHVRVCLLNDVLLELQRRADAPTDLVRGASSVHCAGRLRGTVPRVLYRWLV